MKNTFFYYISIAGLAASFWFSGLFLVRFISSNDLWGGWSGAIIFLLSIPMAAISIRGVQALLKLSSEQVTPAVISITSIVAMLHGVTLTYYPSLYIAQGPQLIFAGAWLVWFVGSVLFSVLLMKTT